MNGALRLVIFDLDGTLVDSAAAIVAAMRAAFRAHGHEPPPAPAVHRVIGLHLPEAVAALLPMPEGGGGAVDPAAVAAVAAAYRTAFVRLDGDPERASALFEGIETVLADLEAEGHLLAVATGKGRRGLDRVLRRHDLLPRFAATRTPDESPGKPHPGMVLDLLDATGVAATDAVVVGDSHFDMAMARNAGVAAIGVAWGTCGAAELLAAGASAVARTPAEIPPLVRRCLQPIAADPAVPPGGD